MKALAGPAMLLVVFGGFALYRGFSAEESPSRKFRELEFGGADSAHTGSCYSLSTVLIANRLGNGATRSWESPREGVWTLKLEEVVQAYGGPSVRMQKFTFAAVDRQVRLVQVDASEGFSTDIERNIDDLLLAPNSLGSAPMERCARAGASGYHFKQK